MRRLIKFECPICGTDVETKDKRRKTCGIKCSRIMYKRREKKYNEKWRNSERGKKYAKAYRRKTK